MAAVLEFTSLGDAEQQLVVPAGGSRYGGERLAARLGAGRRGDAGRAPERRGLAGPRWVALSAACAVVAGVAAMFLAPLGSAGGSTIPESAGEFVVVGPGDTVTSLAAELAPTDEVARYVDGIVALNGGERSLEVGQVVELPTAG